jgi:hypothetical protein
MLNFLLTEAGYRDITTRYQVLSSSARSTEQPTVKTGMDYAIWGFTPPDR